MNEKNATTIKSQKYATVERFTVFLERFKNKLRFLLRTFPPPRRLFSEGRRVKAKLLLARFAEPLSIKVSYPPF